jgi:hypothetical protein
MNLEEIDENIVRADWNMSIENYDKSVAASLLAITLMMRAELEDKLNPVITVDTDPTLYHGYF